MKDGDESKPRRKRPPKPRCGGKTKAGGFCKLGAGASTDHPGEGRCSRHGGSTRNHRRAAERAKAEREAQAAVARFGLDMSDVTAGEALIREVRRSAAMVAYLAFRVSLLDDSQMTWGLTKQKTRHAQAADDDEGDGPRELVESEHEARQNIWIIMLREERLLLAKVAAEAARAGVEERMARQVELEGALMVRLLNAVLGDPELGLTAVQRAAIPNVVPRHLRAIGGEQ